MTYYLLNLQQPPLPAFYDLMTNMSKWQIGSRGEQIAADMLRDQGYTVRRTRRGEPGDLRATSAVGEVLYVEVKTARQGQDRKWRFGLIGRGTACTDYRRSDLLILLAVVNDGEIVPFVIPCANITNKPHAVITSDPRSYRGRLAIYRENWKALHSVNIGAPIVYPVLGEQS